MPRCVQRRKKGDWEIARKTGRTIGLLRARAVHVGPRGSRERNTSAASPITTGRIFRGTVRREGLRARRLRAFINGFVDVVVVVLVAGATTRLKREQCPTPDNKRPVQFQEPF